MNKKNIAWFWVVVGIFLVPLSVGAEKIEETPAGLLRAIKQRNEELDKKAKDLSLKEQRLRILEQEITEKLKKITQTREEVKKREASEIALAAKRVAEEKAIAAKKEAAEKAVEKAKAVTDKAKPETAEKSAAPVAPKKAGKAAPVKAEKEEGDDFAELTQKEKDRKALQDGRFANLAKVYEAMPPEEAALRLQNMREAYAMEIIPRMKTKKAAKVLSAIDPVIAAKYSEKMGSP